MIVGAVVTALFCLTAHSSSGLSIIPAATPFISPATPTPPLTPSIHHCPYRPITERSWPLQQHTVMNHAMIAPSHNALSHHRELKDADLPKWRSQKKIAAKEQLSFIWHKAAVEEKSLGTQISYQQPTREKMITRRLKLVI